MPARLAGALVFLPVPLVLLLFTRAPLGILASLSAGVLLMLTHRLYARPWALARSRTRCLWCGADVVPDAPSAPELALDDPLGRAEWRACSEAHARSVRTVLAWAARRRGLLSVGILGTLVAFLVWATVAGLGWPVRLGLDDGVAFFRLGIAVSVLPLGWLATRTVSGPLEVPRAPFPLHVAALVGLRTVLWLFRLVGLLWLAQGLLHAAARVGLLG